MKLDTKQYEEAYEDFTLYCPMWVDRAVKYTPIHKHIIRVFLDNGDRVEFDNLTKSFRYLAKNKVDIAEELTDEGCRETFAMNLTDMMRDRGIGQKLLSERTGISQSMLSRYLTRRSTPTLTNIRKIAKVLGCWTHELTDM